MSAFEVAVAGQAISEWLLAMRMSQINIEKAGLMIEAKKQNKDPIALGVDFLKSTYYKSWSRAQLNNAEYAPMLALLGFVIKYKRDREGKELSLADKIPMVGSVVFSYIFIYALIAETWVKTPIGPSRTRMVGAGGRYIMMGWLISRVLV